MMCELVVGAMGIGCMHLSWACLTRGWVPMAVMGMLSAVFCAALLGATQGVPFAVIAVTLVVSVSAWLLKTVKGPVKSEVKQAPLAISLATAGSAAQ